MNMQLMNQGPDHEQDRQKPVRPRYKYDRGIEFSPNNVNNTGSGVLGVEEP